jgi:hypothetical protein
MTDPEFPRPLSGAETPSIARIYDYLLGGHNNSAADGPDLVEPGLVLLSEWRPGGEKNILDGPAGFGAVGRVRAH